MQLLTATTDIKPLFTLSGHRNIVHGMVLLPDNSLVSVSEDGTLMHWDLYAQRQLSVHTPHGTCINGIALGHDGRYVVTAGDDRKLFWLEAGSFKTIRQESGHGGYVSRVACTKDGTVISASQDGKVGIWPGETSAKTATKPTFLSGHKGWVYALGVSLDSRLLISAALNNQVLAWDIAARQQAGALYGADAGKTHTVMGDLYIAPKNTSGIGHSDAPHVLKFLPDGRLLSCAKEMILWDTTDWSQTVLYAGNGWQLHQAALFDGGRKVAVVGHHQLKIFDLQSGKELASVMPESGDIHSVAVTSDEDMVLCGGKSGNIMAWFLEELLGSNSTGRHLGSCNSLCWGEVLASGGSDGTARIWSEDGRCLHSLPHTNPNVTVVGVEEGRVFTSHYRMFSAWDAQSGQKLFSGHPSEHSGYNAHALWLAPDKKHVLTTGVLEGLACWMLDAGGWAVCDAFWHHCLQPAAGLEG